MGHKRINNIYDQIYNYENLLKAYRKARKNKRYRTEVLAYTARLSENLLELQKDFKTCTYHPQPYRSFTIYEPKERIIRALPFKDRVAQHALCNVIRSIIERRFYAHSYACIDGRGAHKASHDLSRWYYRLYREWDGNVWVLKGDIHSYFASMSHDVLKRQYRKEIKDRRVLALLDCIVDHNGTGEPVGVPVGNLTSQLFGGMYLTPLDRFVKETLRAKWYMRYMDDFVILARSRLELVEQLEKITEFLHTELRLELNHKTKIYKPMHGIDFVGYRHFHDYRLIRKDSITAAADVSAGMPLVRSAGTNCMNSLPAGQDTQAMPMPVESSVKSGQRRLPQKRRVNLPTRTVKPMTAREIARAALDLADEALALAERKDSCTGGQRRALADLEFEYAIGIFQTTNTEMKVKNNATFQR